MRSARPVARQALSLLDSVTEQINGLNRTLPASDRERLDRFVTDVREIERRIQQSGERVDSNVSLPGKPAGIPEDIEEHIKLMYDLLALAWQTEITRTSTFMLAKELSNAVYPKSGIRDSFHILSHHSNNENSKSAVRGAEPLSRGRCWRTSSRSSPSCRTGTGTLLDHSLVLYGSGMSDGNSTTTIRWPIVLAGHAGGTLQGNRHIRQKELTPMSNLLLAMLEKLGCPEEHFGDSTARPRSGEGHGRATLRPWR